MTPYEMTPAERLEAETGFRRSDFDALGMYIRWGDLWKVARGSSDQSTSWLVDRLSADALARHRETMATMEPRVWLDNLATYAVSVFWEGWEPDAKRVVTHDPYETEPARMSDVTVPPHIVDAYLNDLRRVERESHDYLQGPPQRSGYRPSHRRRTGNGRRGCSAS